MVAWCMRSNIEILAMKVLSYFKLAGTLHCRHCPDHASLL